MEKDSRWNAFPQTSLDYFYSLADSITFRPEVPHDVVRRFEKIKDLLVHSYSQYEFIDTAVNEALLTFEMALATRYEELTGKKAIGKKFKELISWGAQCTLFENDEEAIHALRRLRNVFAHPKKYNLFGVTTTELVLQVRDVINELYEDLELRKVRREEHCKVSEALKEFAQSGAILVLDSNTLIIFLASLLHYDNTKSPPVYCLLFWPIFDPTPDSQNRVDIPRPISHESSHWSHSKDEICFTGHSGSPTCRLVHLENTKDQERFDKWREDFESSSFPLDAEIKMRCAQIRTAVQRQTWSMDKL